MKLIKDKTKRKRPKLRLPGFKLRIEDPGTVILFILAFVLLFFFILAPVASTIWKAFIFEDKISFNWFKYILGIGENVSKYWRLSIINALFAGAMVVLGTSIIGIPVAWILTRFKFHGKSVFRVFALMPLIVPPFVGAFAMKRLLAPNGMISNFFARVLLPKLGFTITNPSSFTFISDSLWSVIFVQIIHLWPLIYLNVASSLSKIDPTLEQSARNLGASGIPHFFRITFPLALPGYAAGALLVFIWVIADLGTPLVLNFGSFYAPSKAFLELFEPEGNIGAAYAAVVVITVISVLALLVVSKFVGTKEYATVRVGAAAESALKSAGSRLTVFFWVILSILTLISSIPHIGVIILTFGDQIHYGDWFPSKFSFNSMRHVLIDNETRWFILNSLVYSFLAMLLAVFLGAIIGYILVRKQIKGKRILDIVSMLPFAIPGMVIAFGYLYFFNTPIGTHRLTNYWFILILSYGMRRLPYAVRSCSAILLQIHPDLESAASNLGASATKKFTRITLPLMAPGILAGGTLAFINSFTEVSTTIVIQPQQPMPEPLPVPNIWPLNIFPGPHAHPITLGIYNEIFNGDPSTAGALGIVQLIVATIGFSITNKILGARTGVAFGG